MQEGLGTAVAMAVTEIAKIICVIGVLFYYSWKVALITIASMSPNIIFTRLSMAWMQSSGVASQKAKANMSASAEESISNVKTVKAFAEERGHIAKFEDVNTEVFEYGRARAYFWAVFFFA